MPVSDQGVSTTQSLVIRRSLVFLFDDKYVLLLKGAATKRLWAGKYNGIGGHIEPGEDILEGIERELAEEAGISDSRLTLSGTIEIDTGNPAWIMISVFWGDYYKSGKISPSDEGELEWHPLRDIANLPVVEDLPQLLDNVIRKRKSGGQFFGYYRYDDEGKLITKFHDL